MKRIFEVKEIDLFNRTMRGTYNVPIDVKPTESFDHCNWLGIKRFD